MRIRQVKPSFWSDSKIARLPLGTRLFYIGTWCLADDAGWLFYDVPEIAHALFGYDDAADREADVTRMLADLLAARRVIDHGCGHLEVPRLGDHQRLAGPTRQVRTVHNDHLRRCVAGNSGEPRGSAGMSGPTTPENPRSGTERNGTDMEQERERKGLGTSIARATASGARLNDEESEFDRLIAQAGGRRP